MTARTILAVTALSLIPAGVARAADDVMPEPGLILTGAVKFPRTQQMRIETDRTDGSKLLLRLAFDGRCKGGGIGEAWVSTLEAKPGIRVRNGRFSGSVRGIEPSFGGVASRTADFRWKIKGRFSATDTATATISGRALIKHRGRIISRCAIAKPVTVKLAGV
jgi:hypothetical protein